MIHSIFSWVKGDTEPGRGPLGRKNKELVRTQQLRALRLVEDHDVAPSTHIRQL